MKRDSFIMRRDWVAAIEGNLPVESQLEAFKAICHFALDHQTDNVSPMVKMAMAFIMPTLEGDADKWIDGRKAMSEAGKKHKGNQYTRKVEMEGASKPSTEMEGASNEWKVVEGSGSFGTNINSSSLFLNNYISFFSHMCAGEEEKKEEFLFEIEKEMLRKGAAKPSKEAERFISYNDSQGWLLKSGRNITDPVAWAKNWSIANPSQEIIQSAEAYIRLLQAARITDRKMLDSLKEIYAEGNMITLKLTSKKAVETFLKAENDETIDRMLLAINLCFPEIQNPQLTYFSPTK